MPEVRILPNGLKPITAETAIYADGKNPPAPKPKNFGVRPGEIFRGIVLEIFSENLIRIEFPFGKVNAAIQAQLLPGDVLYFIVEESAPSLVIRIHSVTTHILSEELSEEEIARILNIRANAFALKVIARLKMKFSKLLRDDLIKIIGFRNTLSENEIQHYSEDHIADILSEELLIGADFTRSNFMKFAKILLPPIDLAKACNYLIEYARANHSLNDELIHKLNLINSSHLSNIDSIQIFLNRELPRASQFYLSKTLIAETNNPAAVKMLEKQFINCAKFLYSAIESQSNYNYRAYLNKSILSFYFLYKSGSAYKIAQILLPYKDIKSKNFQIDLEPFDTEFISDKFKLNRPLLVFFDGADKNILQDTVKYISQAIESDINYLFPKADFNSNYSQTSSGFSIVM